MPSAKSRHNPSACLAGLLQPDTDVSRSLARSLSAQSLLSLMSVDNPVSACRFASNPSWSISAVVWKTSEVSVTNALVRMPFTPTTCKLLRTNEDDAVYDPKG